MKIFEYTIQSDNFPNTAQCVVTYDASEDDYPYSIEVIVNNEFDHSSHHTTLNAVIKEMHYDLAWSLEYQQSLGETLNEEQAEYLARAKARTL